MKSLRHILSVVLLTGIISPAFAADLFGNGYKPCGDQSSTMEIVDCIGAKTKVWDQRLNAGYTTLQHVVEPDQREPLRKAQRLWVTYRDANCGFYGSQQGTIRQIKAAECVRAMTQDRALELEDAARS